MFAAIAVFAFLLALAAVVVAARAHSRLDAATRELRELREWLARSPQPAAFAPEPIGISPEPVGSAPPPPPPAPASIVSEPISRPFEAPVSPAAAAVAPVAAAFSPADAPIAPAAEAFSPPPPPSAPETGSYSPAARAAEAPKPAFDWENVVGIKLFSWIAGIALVLAAVFLFKYSVEHGWLRPPIRAGIGLITGITLLIVCELRVARGYQFTANAMHGAGIAILYATLFAMHQQWQLIPSIVASIGMVLVTAAAVYLSTRRDSVFIALLGLVGGFATPALLSTGENRPLALFSYLLLLNGGISWIAYRKRWPLLTALSVGLTVFYQWSWIDQFLDASQLPLAAGIFIVFALVGASSLFATQTDERKRAFRRIAEAAAVLPLLFAFFTPVVPEYGAQYHVLFAFLLSIACGLAAIALWRGPEWMHTVGGAAVLMTWLVWLTVSYTARSWPWSLVWLAAFIALYLVVGTRLKNLATYTAPLLFMMLIGLAAREDTRDLTLTVAALLLLVPAILFAIRFAMPYVAVIAIAFASIAVNVLDPRQVALASIAHVLLFVALMMIAWIFERHWLLVPAVLFFVLARFTNEPPVASQELAFGTALYALFVAYPLLLAKRAKDALTPFIALAMTSFIYYGTTRDLVGELGFDFAMGALPLALCGVMLATMARYRGAEPNEPRTGLLGTCALAFFTIAIPEQFDGAVVYALFALEALALAWLHTRVQHRGLLFWSNGLSLGVLGALLVDSGVHTVRWVYLLTAASFFAAARIARDVVYRRITASIATIVLFTRLNFEISEYYERQTESLAQDLTYTIAWALFAIAMLVIGLVMRERGARVAALGLLVVTVLKCFLHDLAQLGGLYRVASLFGLAVSLVLVGMLLQKFVIGTTKPSESAPAPNGTT